MIIKSYSKITCKLLNAYGLDHKKWPNTSDSLAITEELFGCVSPFCVISYYKWIQVLLLKKQKEITLLCGVVTLSFLRFLHSWFQEVIITFWWSKCQLNNVIMTISFYWSFFLFKVIYLSYTELGTSAHIFYTNSMSIYQFKVCSIITPEDLFF